MVRPPLDVFLCVVPPLWRMNTRAFEKLDPLGYQLSRSICDCFFSCLTKSKKHISMVKEVLVHPPGIMWHADGLSFGVYGLEGNKEFWDKVWPLARFNVSIWVSTFKDSLITR